MAAKKPESKIVDKIQAWIEEHEGTVLKNHGDPMSKLGTPDLIGGMIVRRKYGHATDAEIFISFPFAVEVKLPGEDASELQYHRLGQWRRVDYRTGVIHSLDEFIEFVELHTRFYDSWSTMALEGVDEDKLYVYQPND